MSTRVIKLANVIVPVADQDRALQFYTEALGLEKRVDLPFGGVKDTGISLQADDIDTYHAQLKDRGVDVDAEVSRFGDAAPPLFWFRDPGQHAHGRRGSMIQSAGTIAARIGDVLGGLIARLDRSDRSHAMDSG